MKRLITLLTISLISSGCASLPDAPEPIICANVQERGYLRCKDSSNGRRFNLPYVEAERYICTPPEDYADTINYLDAILDALRSEGKNL